MRYFSCKGTSIMVAQKSAVHERKGDYMSHSILEDIFVFVLILAGVWCVQYSFTSLFETLIYDCLPAVLDDFAPYYRNYSLMERIIRLLPFAIFYGLICFLICSIAELTVDEASQTLYAKKKLKKYCLDQTHQAFFSQMLAFAITLVTAGWLTIDSTFWKFGYLILAGGFVMAAFLFLCLLASYCNANGVRLLWALTAFAVFVITWIVSGKFMFSAVFVLLSLFMIPLRDRIKSMFSRVFDNMLKEVLSVSEDDPDDFDDDDDDLLF